MCPELPLKKQPDATPASEEHSATALAGDPRAWVDEHGDALFRYAQSRLKDRSAAEDLVQETFLAALGARKRFRGASAPRTWLISVLRNKLVDHLRRSGRQLSVEDPEALDVGATFDSRGRWVQRPGAWVPEAPVSALERQEFRSALDACVDGVAGRAGEAYALRVLCDVSAEEVCKVMEVKPTNLWVLLHRARTQLRNCLERTWFDRPEKEGPQC